MTPSELKYELQKRGNSHFFDRETMKTWGDTMRNFGCRSAVVKTRFSPDQMHTTEPREVEVWELYQKRPTNGNTVAHSYYFSKGDFKCVLPMKEEV